MKKCLQITNMMCFWASTYGSGYPDPPQNVTDPDAENYTFLSGSKRPKSPFVAVVKPAVLLLEIK
jgi:hypothetical protein